MQSPAGPMEGGCFERHIEFERCFNFRDLGGYVGLDGRTVRWRRLFRSMTPEYFSTADIEAARALGIGLVIDLRGPRFKTSGPLGEQPARRVAPGRRRPLTRNRQALREYLELPPDEALPLVVDRMGPAFARAAGLIADEEAPVLIHCRLGKDRTGVFSAILLRLLGVQEETVIHDYLLSALSGAAARRLLAEMEPPDQRNESRVAREPPDRAAIENTLHRLERQYGGAEEYLRLYGLSPRKIRVLRTNLLE